MLQASDPKRSFDITHRYRCQLRADGVRFPQVLGSLGADFWVVPGPFQKLTTEIPVWVPVRSGRFGVVILKVLVCHGFRLALEVLVRQVGSFWFPQFLAAGSGVFSEMTFAACHTFLAPFLLG